MKQVEVSGAIIVKDNKILCAKRGKGKYEYISYRYEFPGGKLEIGETPKEALHRELIEEMDVDISPEEMTEFSIIEYPYPDFFLKMYCFICKMSNDKINLKEHVDIQWKTLDNILELDWVPADLPVVKELIKRGFE